MSIAFSPGQTLGRGDLDIFLTNANGNASNAAQISYALYYVDPATSVEVLIGADDRTPVNPTVGEYYAALMAPPAANPGVPQEGGSKGVVGGGGPERRAHRDRPGSGCVCVFRCRAIHDQ